MRRHPMMDYLMSRDYNRMPEMDYARARDRRGRFKRRDYDMEHPYHYRDYEHSEHRTGHEDHPYERTREYYGSYGNVPFYVKGGEDYARMRDYDDYNYGRYYDYADKLSKADIDEWVEKLMKHLASDEKEMFKMDKVIKKANDLGIKFDKFSEGELYVTVLMLYTDYKATLGKSNVDMYIRLAKDFLCDEDASKQYGEKLTAYYDYIVED